MAPQSEQREGDVVVEESEVSPPTPGLKTDKPADDKHCDTATDSVNNSLTEKEKTERFVENLVKDLIKSSIAELQRTLSADKAPSGANHKDNKLAGEDIESLGALVNNLELNDNGSQRDCDEGEDSGERRSADVKGL